MNSKDYTASAIEYLFERPDWDGRTIVVTGGSQGGLQSLVAAGLNPKATVFLILEKNRLAGGAVKWQVSSASARMKGIYAIKC